MNTPKMDAGWSKDELASLRSLVTRLKGDGGVQIKDRRWYLKSYSSCFVGSEMVDWLVQHEGLTRAQSVQKGLEMQAAGFLHHVTRDHVFKDAALWYVFSSSTDEDSQKSWADLVDGMGSLFGETGSSEVDRQLNGALRNSNYLSAVMGVMHSAHTLAPLDDWNLKLLDNVHPKDWVPPTPSGGRYNLVVIGAGTAGLVTASAAAGLGAKVALIERHLMGGDCLNVGCVPSKALLACAKRVHQVRTASEFGVVIEGEVRVDFAAIMKRMRKIRAEISWNDGAPRYARQFGVDVFFGNAKFSSNDEVEVSTGEKLKFARAVICTGARASIPNILGLQNTPFMTNESIFNLEELPASMIVIGAGVVGCELAQAFARLGCKVTMLMRGTQVLKGEDPEAVVILEKALLADGVIFEKNMSFQEVSYDKGSTSYKILPGSDDKEVVHLQEPGVFTVRVAAGVLFKAAALLVATGRAPNTENLGLEVVGVRLDPTNSVVVNERLQTTNAHIFAAGDCCSQFKFTHAADFQARTVLRNALFFGKSKHSTLLIPWCTYTDPEIAHVGLSEADADALNAPVDTFRVDFHENDRSLCEGDSQGFVKIFVERSTDKIVGATICGSHAGDMISEVTMAIQQGIGLSATASVIHPYPTKQDAVRRCGDLYNRTKVTPAVKSVFRNLLSARRGGSK